MAAGMSRTDAERHAFMEFGNVPSSGRDDDARPWLQARNHSCGGGLPPGAVGWAEATNAAVTSRGAC